MTQIKSVYLAARFSRLRELDGYAADLDLNGIGCTSRWLLGGHEWAGTDDDALSNDVAAQFAADDLEDIDAADLVIIFTEPPRSSPARGGKHVELGYALARSKPIIRVGPIENVFYALPSVTGVASWPEALALLTSAGMETT